MSLFVWDGVGLADAMVRLFATSTVQHHHRW